jgi:hypothetical protein
MPEFRHWARDSFLTEILSNGFQPNRVATTKP